MTKRTTTKTTDTLKNGGIHSVRHYKAACDWINTHTFINAQLWHIVLFGSTDRASYQKALDRLLELLRDAGMRVEWRAAYEYDSEKESHKALHRHVFLMIEASTHKPIAILNNKAGATGLRAKLALYGVKFHIAPPGDDLGIHGGQPYMYVPKKEGVKRHDCREWIAYIYKVRSKAGVVGTIYSASRNRATKAPEQAAHATNEQEETMPLPTLPLSPVGFAYLGDVYEQAVDAGLNLTEIQAHLSKRGIHKGLMAIRYDLDHVFSFSGYAASHPAPAYQTLAEIDAVLRQRQPARQVRLSV
ncbi:hypothetical protein HD842_004162 [Massilia aurea]|uniref:Replication protein n=1 Tax=Massilia aurea TaxID=373040 RepID=A0A7X0CG54_9BURK|nr:hypothetical protein [Massilia aurea]MBB6135985.1 hypothetical protein [Massilia aurea]